MTQQQLADLVHVSSRTIISIEKEQYSPSLMLAYRMAQVFGTTVEELCCLQETKNGRTNAMKIYNKKGFFLGIFWVLLAIGCAVADLRRPDPNMLIRVRDWVLTVFVFLLGISSFWRAFSRSATREDRIEEMDERNRLVEIKSKAGCWTLCMVRCSF